MASVDHNNSISDHSQKFPPGSPINRKGKQRKRLLPLLYCLLSFCFIFLHYSPESRAAECLYIAHRGDIDDAPEESYAAVDVAIENGYRAVECDVWKTASEEYLVFHDSNLYKLCGVKKDISEVSSKTIKDYPYKNTKYGVQYILTFSEMVKYVKQKKIDVFFHLKAGKVHFTKADLSNLQAIIDEQEMQDNVYLFSSNPEIVANMKETITSFRGGLNIRKNLDSLKRYADNIKNEHNCSFVIFKYTPGKTDDPALIDYCHKRWMKVCYFNIVDKEETKRLKSIGADMLILNKPVFAE